MTFNVDANTQVRIELQPGGLYRVVYNNTVHYAETATGAMVWVLNQPAIGGVH